MLKPTPLIKRCPILEMSNSLHSSFSNALLGVICLFFLRCCLLELQDSSVTDSQMNNMQNLNNTRGQHKSSYTNTTVTARQSTSVLRSPESFTQLTLISVMAMQRTETKRCACGREATQSTSVMKRAWWRSWLLFRLEWRERKKKKKEEKVRDGDAEWHPNGEDAPF